MTGRITRIHNIRDSTDGSSTHAQIWVVTTEDDKEFLLTVKKGQYIEFSLKKGTAYTIEKVELCDGS